MNRLRKMFKCECIGVEPSRAAIEDGGKKFPNIKFINSTADSLPFKDGYFDHIIIGFCLYLCDRDDLFKISYEIGRVLDNNGWIYLLDFLPPFPYAN